LVVLGRVWAETRVSDLVPLRAFSEIESDKSPLIALFYHGSDPESKQVIRSLAVVAKNAAKRFPFLKFVRCDGDLSENKDSFKNAQFSASVSYLFTQTPEEGIQKYGHELNANTIWRHIKYTMETVTDDRVRKFVDEDDIFEKMDNSDPPRPQFVKFYEEWCTHCKATKKPFQIASRLFKDHVDFVEVECSKNEDTKAFCQRHNVNSYPVLKLFTPEEQINYEEGDRSVLSFKKFLENKLDIAIDSKKSTTSQPIPQEEERGKDEDSAPLLIKSLLQNYGNRVSMLEASLGLSSDDTLSATKASLIDRLVDIDRRIVALEKTRSSCPKDEL